jgi:GTP pyrophosphokinase
MEPTYLHSDRLARAFDYAAICHAAQRRKGTDIHYLSHLMGVASLVMEAADEEARGTDLEDLVIAALLHDVVEDHGGRRRLEDVEQRFGLRVAKLVHGCTDVTRAPGEPKPPWTERKRAYIGHLKTCEDPSTLLVSAADKLHNARSILTDLRVCRDRGWPQRKFWDRFVRHKPGAHYPERINGILGYYRALADGFTDKASVLPSRGLRRLSLELNEVVAEIEALAAEDGLAPRFPEAPTGGE